MTDINKIVKIFIRKERTTIKKIFFSLILILLIICLLIYNLFSKKIKITTNDVKQITIIKLPSPPKKKIITNKKDISKIINFINSIKLLKKINDPIKGWVYSIKFENKSNYNIDFLGDKININGTWYEIDSSKLNELDSIYKELNYKEISFLKDIQGGFIK